MKKSLAFKTTLVRTFITASVLVLFMQAPVAQAALLPFTQNDLNAVNKSEDFRDTVNTSLVCDPRFSTGIQPASVYILGDSIVAAAKDKITTEVAKTEHSILAINADPGRAISKDTSGAEPSGLGAVENDTALIRQSDMVVVALGTNSGTETLSEQIPLLIQAIRDAKAGGQNEDSFTIVWVDMFYERPAATRNSRNQTIKDLSGSLDYRIITMSAESISVQTDGTHPNLEGVDQYASALARGIALNAPRSGGGGATTNSDGSIVWPIVGGVSQTGNPNHILSYPIGLNEVDAANAINLYIQEKKPQSPFNGLGESFVTGGKKYNVNPFVAVAHLRIENGFASANGGWHSPSTLYKTQDAARAQDRSQLGAESNNAFGRSASSTQPRVFYRQSSGTIRLVFQWTSWAASLDGSNGEEDPWFALINRRYLAIPASGNSSFGIAAGDFAAYIARYAPKSDGNSETGYVSDMYEIIDAVVAKMGTGVAFTGPIGVTNSACGENAAPTAEGPVPAGVNGWDLPGEGPNPLKYYYSQICESCAKYGGYTDYYGPSLPYGNTTIQQAGCGPVSAAVVVSNLLGQKVEATEMANWFSENGYQESTGGSFSSYFGLPSKIKIFEEKWGVSSRRIGNSAEAIAAEIRQGNFVVVSVRAPSPLVSGSAHITVIRGVTDDGKFLFADTSDSNTKNRIHSTRIPQGSSRTPLSFAEFGPLNSGMYAFERVRDVR